MRTLRQIILTALLGVFAARAADRYVSSAGSNSGARDSWATAYTNIQHALDAAANNDTIYLAGQTFLPTNQLVWTTPGVTLRGGYKADPLDVPGTNNPALWPTVIKRSGVANHRVLHINGAHNSTLESVTLTGGYETSENGGGVWLSSGTNIVFSGCVIAGNSFYRVTSGTRAGGGIYAASGTGLTLIGCTIRDNSGNNASIQVNARGHGGGIFSLGALTIRDSWIRDNRVTCSRTNDDSSNGGGNISADPRFVDRTYYHLQSSRGNYINGYFSGGSWSESAQDSPCLDAGDPSSDYLREPQPNGHRINLGAYGGTEVASKGAPPGGTVFMLR